MFINISGEFAISNKKFYSEQLFELTQDRDIVCKELYPPSSLNPPSIDTFTFREIQEAVHHYEDKILSLLEVNQTNYVCLSSNFFLGAELFNFYLVDRLRYINQMESIAATDGQPYANVICVYPLMTMNNTVEKFLRYY